MAENIAHDLIRQQASASYGFEHEISINVRKTPQEFNHGTTHDVEAIKKKNFIPCRIASFNEGTKERQTRCLNVKRIDLKNSSKYPENR
jgi:hypothetical protein